jgi:hypothetical protein
MAWPSQPDFMSIPQDKRSKENGRRRSLSHAACAPPQKPSSLVSVGIARDMLVR